MKLMCLYDRCVPNGKFRHYVLGKSNIRQAPDLTVGKIYEIVNYDKKVTTSNHSYLVKNDKGETRWYPKRIFKTLQEMRNETINKILEE